MSLPTAPPAARRRSASAALRLALGATLVPGLALPLLAVPAGAAVLAPAAAVQERQAEVSALDGRCGVRVALQPGTGVRAVDVDVVTAAPTTPAGREVVLEQDGVYAAPAGEARDIAFTLGDARAGDAQGQRVEVTVVVDGTAPERTLLWLPACGTPSPSPSASPVTSPSASPSAAASPSASPSVSPSVSPAVSPSSSATPTATTSPAGETSPAAASPADAPVGGPGTSGGVDLPGAPGSPAAPAETSASGPAVAALPALAAPGTSPAAAAPLPQLAATSPLLFPPVPEAAAPEDPAFALSVGTRREPDAVAELLPAGTGLALSVLALRGLVRRRRV